MWPNIKFLQNKLLQKLFAHRAITVFAQSFISGFGVMFIYQVTGEKLWVPLVAYAFMALFTVMAAPFSGLVFNALGTRYSLLMGISGRLALWLSLLFTTETTWMYTIPIYTAAVAFIRFWYWPAFNNTLTLSTNKTNRTQALALLSNVRNSFGLFMPTAVGFLLSLYGFGVPLLIGTILIALSFIPLINIKVPNVVFSWNPKEVILNLKKKEYRNFLTAEFFNGFEGTFGGVLWPIVVFILLSGNYFSIGIVASATTLFLIIANTISARIGDKLGKNKKLLRYSSSLSSIGWILKAFVETALEVFAVRSFSRVSGSLTSLSLESMSFTFATKDKKLTDELIILREIALNGGRVFGYFFILIAALYIPLQYLFVFAALAALALNLIPSQNQQK